MDDGLFNVISAGIAIAAAGVGYFYMKKDEDVKEEESNSDKNNSNKKTNASKKKNNSKKKGGKKSNKENKNTNIGKPVTKENVVSQPPVVEKKVEQPVDTKVKTKKNKGKGENTPLANGNANPTTSNTNTKAKKKKGKKDQPVEKKKVATKTVEATATPAVETTLQKHESSSWETVPSRNKKKKAAVVNVAGEEEIEVDVSTGSASLVLEIGDFAGAIVGPKGVTINGIQQDSGAKVNLDKASKTCTIEGTPEQVNIAKMAVIDIIGSRKKIEIDLGAKRSLVFGPNGETVRDIQNKTGARIEMGDRTQTVATLNGKDTAVNEARKLILDILNSTNIGSLEIKDTDKAAIIGRAGANIRLLQEQSGAVIEFKDDYCLFTGEPAQVKKAEELIKLYIVHRGPPPECTEIIQVPTENGRIIMGKKGVNVMKLQETTKTRINIELGTDIAKVTIAGDNDAVFQCQTAIKQLIADNSFQEKVNLSSPNLIKAIIGEKGVTINKIRDASGARIDISSNDQYVTLVGTKDQVKKAKSMVEKTIAIELGPPAIPNGQIQHGCDMGDCTGKLIGSAGSNLTRLEKENGVKIDIKQNTYVYVTGPEKGVDAVKKEMEDIMKRHQEQLERAAQQEEETARMLANSQQNGTLENGDDLSIDFKNSSYSTWDAPPMSGNWSCMPITSFAPALPSTTITNSTTTPVVSTPVVKTTPTTTTPAATTNAIKSNPVPPGPPPPSGPPGNAWGLSNNVTTPTSNHW